ERLGAERLAVANPDTVPAGKYAKQALTALGVWSAEAPKLAPTENVRAALMLVSRGETPLGIVYRTDAMADTGVIVVDAFPASSHAPIVYPAALTPGATPAAARVLAFLRSAEARAVFVQQGFLVDVK
ncbi:MAG: molybdate ABC transporter substrate-binding protein, partial [Acidobacteriota bacterium]